MGLPDSREGTDFPAPDSTLGANYMANKGVNFYPDPLPKERRELVQHSVLAHKLLGDDVQARHPGTSKEPCTCLCPTLPTEDQVLLRTISQGLLDKRRKGHKRRAELRRHLQTVLQIRLEQGSATGRRGDEIQKQTGRGQHKISGDTETSQTRKEAEPDCGDISTDVLSSDETDEVQPTEDISDRRPLLSRSVRHGKDNLNTPRTLLSSEQGMDRILSQNGGNEPLLGRIRPAGRSLARRSSHSGSKERQRRDSTTKDSALNRRCASGSEVRIDSLPEQTSHHIINATPTELARQCGEENYQPIYRRLTDTCGSFLIDSTDAARLALRSVMIHQIATCLDLKSSPQWNTEREVTEVR